MFKQAKHGESGTRAISNAQPVKAVQECPVTNDSKVPCLSWSGCRCWTACKLKKCAGPVVLTLLPTVGGSVGAVYLRKDYRLWYEHLKKPGWCAQHWHFFPTYNVLYPAMGLASYLIVKEHGFEGPAKTALMLYGAHLGLSWLWVPLLFKRRYFAMAFADSVAVACLSGATLWTFRPLNDTAATLFFPSFLWSVYLALTSFFVLRRNGLVH